MSRRLVYVVGPSGAGKDSLLAWLAQHLPPEAGVQFARRTITRAVQAGGEAHEAVDLAAFEHLSDEGAFATQWSGNGVRYGVRHGELVPRGDDGWVFVNGSRAHLPRFLADFPDSVIVHVTANRETLMARLLARGRESAAEIDARLDRLADEALPATSAATIRVDNDGALDESGQALLAGLRRISGWLG